MKLRVHLFLIFILLTPSWEVSRADEQKGEESSEEESSILFFNNQCPVKLSNERIANFMSRDESTLQIINFNELIKFRIGARLLDPIFNYETTTYILKQNLELSYGMSEASLKCLINHHVSMQLKLQNPDLSLINSYYKKYLDKELLELIAKNSKKIENLSLENKKSINKSPGYWDSLISRLENDSLDIPKITAYIEENSILNLFDENIYSDEKKCLISKKIISPFIQFNYSAEKVKYVDLLFQKLPTCSIIELENNKIFPTNDARYFAKWCTEEQTRDKKKCMLYFNSRWKKGLGKCQKDTQCSLSQVPSYGTFYYNHEMLETKKERDFFTQRSQFFNTDQSAVFFPFTAPAICRSGGCGPKFSTCDPLLLFDELINLQSKTHFNKCEKDSDCQLALFSSKHLKHDLPFTISSAFFKSNQSYMQEIFDEIVLDCQEKNGSTYINQDKIHDYIKQKKDSARCEKFQCKLIN